MANKKINDLGACTDSEAIDDTRLYPNADPTTGIAKKATFLQSRVKKLKYVSDDTEASTLTISALADKIILLIARESGIIFEVDSSPTSSEFTWDGTDIVLGVDVSGSNERFLILYI